LCKFAIDSLKKITDKKEDPESYFIDVIEKAMIFDYERARERRVLTKNELEQYYKNAFAPVINIALMITKSQLRQIKFQR